MHKAKLDFLVHDSGCAAARGAATRRANREHVMNRLRRRCQGNRPRAECNPAPRPVHARTRPVLAANKPDRSSTAIQRRMRIAVVTFGPRNTSTNTDHLAVAGRLPHLWSAGLTGTMTGLPGQAGNYWLAPRGALASSRRAGGVSRGRSLFVSPWGLGDQK